MLLKSIISFVPKKIVPKKKEVNNIPLNDLCDIVFECKILLLSNSDFIASFVRRQAIWLFIVLLELLKSHWRRENGIFKMTGLVYVSFNFGMAKSDTRRVEMILICLDDLN